jgi:hypothetical protein
VGGVTALTHGVDSQVVDGQSLMNGEEKIAKNYLVDREGPNVVYEPNGEDTFPDFLVNERIAVEVRRLNQNEVIGSSYRGLEETRLPLEDKMRKFLPSMGPPKSGVSWFVLYTVKRPVPDWPRLRSTLRRYLETVQDGHPHEGQLKATILDGFEVQLLRAGDTYATAFRYGGYSDEDSGGWELAELHRNLGICIAEKTSKRDRCSFHYPEWWLVFVDRIAYGIADCDRERYREFLEFEHDWDKIILLSPDGSGGAFELL